MRVDTCRYWTLASWTIGINKKSVHSEKCMVRTTAHTVGSGESHGVETIVLVFSVLLALWLRHSWSLYY